MSQHTLQIDLATPDDTCALAQALARELSAGDTVLLAGRVGAGKSHFARSFIQTLLTHPEDIPSPTFTLVQSYDSTAGEIWHADLYRLTDFSEVEELGLYQAFSEAICLVEWPDRLADQAPANALTLSLEDPFGDDRRVATLSWAHPSWGETLKKVLND